MKSRRPPIAGFLLFHLRGLLAGKKPNGKRMLKQAMDFTRNLAKRRKDVLVYVGLHTGRSFRPLFHRYRVCYGFEANPELFAELQEEYRSCPNVRLFNLAAADRDGEIEFNITSNDGGASSSIGRLDENFNDEIRIVKTIRVPCVNLCRFLEQQGVDYIDDYISDIQGMDLEVLKTLEPLIRRGRIGSISCEVTKDKYRNCYSDLPDNHEAAFNRLLSANYTLAAKGWGILKDGQFNEVPEHWWEMDCKWNLKRRPPATRR
ncbi:MAG: FkbM family methyltransferase [Gammaproteobacteria bacterium]|nr:FkbM family methyltransferase [Gammaproteobacteria bacterium]MDD9868919.1 FkbM family methyltransferase [Gammaproteobacteria bacterium]